MQKCKLIFSFILTFCFVSPFAEAVGNGSAGANSPSAKSGVQETTPAPVQQHLIDMMQDDFAFENQKRALANELELEKLRSAISKTRETYAPVSVPAVTAPEPEVASSEPVRAVVEPTSLPKVLLVSEIGGISRVAISLNNTVKLVRLNEHFSLDGHKFMVFNGGYNMPSVKEVAQ